jgi:hypothetical protein
VGRGMTVRAQVAAAGPPAREALPEMHPFGAGLDTVGADAEGRVDGRFGVQVLARGHHNGGSLGGGETGIWSRALGADTNTEPSARQRAESRACEALPPAQVRRDVLEDALDCMGVVLDAELVRDRQKERVRGLDSGVVR